MNPLGLDNGSAGNPAYAQPGFTPQIYDLGADRMACPYGPEIAARIGSSAYTWRCEAGHQFELFNGAQPQLIPAAHFPPVGVRDERRLR
jgi:hypothetical protein